MFLFPLVKCYCGLFYLFTFYIYKSSFFYFVFPIYIPKLCNWSDKCLISFLINLIIWKHSPKIQVNYKQTKNKQIRKERCGVHHKVLIDTKRKVGSRNFNQYWGFHQLKDSRHHEYQKAKKKELKSQCFHQNSSCVMVKDIITFYPSADENNCAGWKLRISR